MVLPNHVRLVCFGSLVSLRYPIFVFVQAEIQATDERMLAESYAVGPVDSWLDSFVEWAGTSTEYR